MSHDILALMQSIAAAAMAAVILVRCICVLYMTTQAHHRHPVLFYGFGYSYVVLGAGAAFSAVALLADRHDLAEWALLALLAGSCGLIAFDRRAARCWMVTNCPMEIKEVRRVDPK